ncbi:unnamed protein product [Ixodes pacificus]
MKSGSTVFDAIIESHENLHKPTVTIWPCTGPELLHFKHFKLTFVAMLVQIPQILAKCSTMKQCKHFGAAWHSNHMTECKYARKAVHRWIRVFAPTDANKSRVKRSKERATKQTCPDRQSTLSLL